MAASQSLWAAYIKTQAGKERSYHLGRNNWSWSSTSGKGAIKQGGTWTLVDAMMSTSGMKPSFPTPAHAATSVSSWQTERPSPEIAIRWREPHHPKAYPLFMRAHFQSKEPPLLQGCKGMAPLPQGETTLKGLLSSKALCMIDWSLSCNCLSLTFPFGQSCFLAPRQVLVLKALHSELPV